MKPTIRELFLPPAGRPRWVCPEGAQLDLLYLSWGKRYFGENPIPVSLHPGWVYALVCHGHPILQLAIGTVRTRPGDLLLIDPDCASGWTSAPGAVTELATWMWRTPPRCTPATPQKGSYLHFSPPARPRQHWLRLHRSSRDEVGGPDCLTKLAIEHLRLELDVAIARAVERRSVGLEPAMRMELALRWLAQNVSDPHPIGTLCEYLQISPITLNRLFRAKLGESVAEWHHRARIHFAIDNIKSKMTIKEVGYLLGYRHPNDLSRAIKRATGQAASTLSSSPEVRKRC